MIENLCTQLLANFTQSNAYALVRECRTSNMFSLGIHLGALLSRVFPRSIRIVDEYAICCYYAKQYERSYDAYEYLFQTMALSEQDHRHLRFNQHFSDERMLDRYTSPILYSPPPPPALPLVTFTVTTCKRLALFKQTMNSFLQCCLDKELIARWICVDDNSSAEDRAEMAELYPFMEFHHKGPDRKGHPQSMNLILDLVETPFVFHMEDDWKFFRQDMFISKCMQIVTSDERYGQCLINRNYAEELGKDIVGGIRREFDGHPFYEHEYLTKAEEIAEFEQQHGKHCFTTYYWPHYSLRPSLIRRAAMQDIGRFQTDVAHFEMHYAWRYASKYVSVFLPDIYCVHIGRLTKDRFDNDAINAYKLNDTAQFSVPKKRAANMKSIIINLERRKDRLERMAALDLPFKPLLFRAVDGRRLKMTHMLARLFEPCYYNYRCGIVGVALSHLKLLCDHQNSDVDRLLILEDDITLCDDFARRFETLTGMLDNLSDQWDIVCLQYLPRHPSTDKDFTLVKTDGAAAFGLSYGGAAAYMMTPAGIRRFLEFVNRMGMTNAIDTMQQNAAAELNVYYCVPPLITTPSHKDPQLDSDIQFDYTTVPYTVGDVVHEERTFYARLNVLCKIDEYTDEQVCIQTFESRDALDGFLREHPDSRFYTLFNRVLVTLPPTVSEAVADPRYHRSLNPNRMRVGDRYCIDSCLLVK
jgi:GR25 family glycosyltransferase involved in LPS biosynthesis